MNPALLENDEKAIIRQKGGVKKDWLYYLACLVAPHIMLFVGLFFLTRADSNQKILGKRICITSSIILIAGSLAYYMFFTPIFGLD